MSEQRESSQDREKEPFYIVEIGFAQVGKSPERCEDAFLCNEDLQLFAVADGVSGTLFSKEAAEAACKWLQELMLEDKILRNKDLKLAEAARKSVISGLKNKFYVINQRMINLPDSIPEDEKRKLKETVGNEVKAEIGQTTLSFVKIIKSGAGEVGVLIGYVGDSRVYFYQSGRLRQVSEDDSWLVRESGYDKTTVHKISKFFDNVNSEEELSRAVDVGGALSVVTYENGTSDFAVFSDMLSLFYARNHASQFVGANSLKPNLLMNNLSQDTEILICSDAIHNNLTHNEIQEIMNGYNSPTEKTSLLINRARSRMFENGFRSNLDDATAIIIKISLKT